MKSQAPQNVQAPEGQRHATITWQDVAYGEIYSVELPGEQCVCTACPHACNSVLVGTRKNANEGNGRLYCFRQGDLTWAYQPGEIAEYPNWTSWPNTTLLRAYPARIACSDDNDRVAFTFLNYIYVLNSSGALLKKWAVGELLEQLFEKRFYPELFTIPCV